MKKATEKFLSIGFFVLSALLWLVAMYLMFRADD